MMGGWDGGPRVAERLTLLNQFHETKNDAKTKLTATELAENERSFAVRAAALEFLPYASSFSPGELGFGARSSAHESPALVDLT